MNSSREHERVLPRVGSRPHEHFCHAPEMGCVDGCHSRRIGIGCPHERRVPRAPTSLSTAEGPHPIPIRRGALLLTSRKDPANQEGAALMSRRPPAGRSAVYGGRSLKRSPIERVGHGGLVEVVRAAQDSPVRSDQNREPRPAVASGQPPYAPSPSSAEIARLEWDSALPRHPFEQRERGSLILREESSSGVGGVS